MSKNKLAVFYPDMIEITADPLLGAKSSVLTATELALAWLLIGPLSSTVRTLRHWASWDKGD